MGACGQGTRRGAEREAPAPRLVVKGAAAPRPFHFSSGGTSYRRRHEHRTSEEAVCASCAAWCAETMEDEGVQVDQASCSHTLLRSLAWHRSPLDRDRRLE